MALILRFDAKNAYRLTELLLADSQRSSQDPGAIDALKSRVRTVEHRRCLGDFGTGC
jgi:hypothetical protein